MQHGAELVGFMPGLEERRALIDRILASRAFESTARLKDLLIYLAERSETDEPIREQEIGVSIFGRPAGYDTSHDTLVRVQISHLRKKLQQYFEEEGCAESWEILIPKGNYLLTYRALNQAPTAVEPEPTTPAASRFAAIAEPAEHRPWFRSRTATIGVIVLLGALSVAGVLRHQATAAPARTARTQLWNDIFGNGQPPYLVLADANLIEFEDAIGHQFTPGEYDTKNFEGFATQRIDDAAVRKLVLRALSRPLTSVVDVQATQRLVLWAAEAGGRMEIVGARDMSLRHIASQNTILLGSRRADPWVTLFEDRLNFQTVFEEGKPPRAWFANRKPQAGEQSEYRVNWGTEGFCRVAYLPNPKSSGATLLLSGTDLYSSESGAEFITREDRIRELRTKLGLTAGEKMPPFEVLLRTRVVASAAPDFQLLAWRRY